MYQGGVASLLREDMQQHIKQIERVELRILQIMRSAKNPVAPIVVLASYAPRNGYTIGVGVVGGGRNQNWGLAQATIDQIPTTTLRIWCADSDG